MSEQINTGAAVDMNSSSQLKKNKFTVMGMAFLIYCMCAGGAFGIEEMIPSSGPGLTIVLLIAIPLLWAAPIGIYTAELGALAPVDAGPYVWMKMAYGEMWGFCMNWWLMLAIYLGQASYVVLAVGYIDKFISLTPVASMIIKVAIVLILTAVNLVGLKEVSIISTIFTLVILAAFALVTIVGFANWNYSPVTPFIPEGQNMVGSLGTGLCIGIWMFCGYIQISNLGGEIENPKVIPKGMKVSIILITLSYILPTISGLASVGNWQQWGSDMGGSTLNYSSVLTQNLGSAWGIGFMAVAIIAQCAIVNSVIASGSRLFMVLGEDNLCPKFLTKLTKNSKVPYWPILILAAITIVFVNFDFSMIVSIISPTLFVLYVGLGFAFLKIRKKYPVKERGVYYAKGGKLIEVYVIASLFVVGIIGLMVNGTEFFLLGFIVITSGVVAYIIFKLIYGGLYKIDPEKYPINPKTKLAQGDIWRFGIFFIIFGILMFVGSFVLGWYEGDAGPAYYLETYGTGLLSDFWGMVSAARWCGAGMAVVGLVLYFIGKKVDA